MAETRMFRVHVHQDAEGWWAESLDAPGFTAVGRTRDELDQQVAGGLRFLLADETISFVIVYLFGEPRTTEAGVAPATPQQRASRPHDWAEFEARGVSRPTSDNARGVLTISGNR